MTDMEHDMNKTKTWQVHYVSTFGLINN